jgi:hypothetical protein
MKGRQYCLVKGDVLKKTIALLIIRRRRLVILIWLFHSKFVFSKNKATCFGRSSLFAQTLRTENENFLVSMSITCLQYVA